ncbi:MAG: PHP domain-containing protein [Succinivibrio sp.]|jgi:putative hydrolase|nr:PHP domain-containing protein [Succinivibrio sp.]
MSERYQAAFPVDLHTHTVASDHAYSTIHDYIRLAPQFGISMFACTDHGPAVPDAPYPWHFKNLRVVPRVCEGVAVLRGMECNILEDGKTDLPPEAKLDVVLAGFHPNLTPSDPDTHTRLMLKVIESGKIDIISHPGVANFPMDYEAVLECAKQHSVAVEINSSSSVNTRLGSHENCVRIAALAKKIGNIVSVGSDAHIAYFMGHFEEALDVIKESALPLRQIINLSPSKVLDFLESRGHERIGELRDFFEKPA